MSYSVNKHYCRISQWRKIRKSSPVTLTFDLEIHGVSCSCQEHAHATSDQAEFNHELSWVQRKKLRQDTIRSYQVASKNDMTLYICYVHTTNEADISKSHCCETAGHFHVRLRHKSQKATTLTKLFVVLLKNFYHHNSDYPANFHKPFPHSQQH